MGFIIAHRIDYNWVEALRDQRHIPNKINPSTPPTPPPPHLHSLGISRFSRCQVIAPLIPTFLIEDPTNRAQVTYRANLGKPIVPIV